MQKSGSMPQAPPTCDPPAMRSLSDPPTHLAAGANSLGGKYDIRKKIELYKGSVSTVYKCLLASGSPVVVKTYHKARMAEKHFHKLEREIAAMRALGREVGKKGIVQLLDTFEDSHGIYLVMECCEGGDLFKRLMLHGGKLPEHWVCVQVIAPLLHVLDRMHDLHIMHRDIKPENIFISADGEVKLGDFGLAIDWTKELPFSRSGTLDYMAPEVLMNPATHTQESPAITVPQLMSKNIRPYSAAVDVWAVGCLAYELVCGRPPFEVEDEKQTASLIIYSNNIHFDHHANPAWADFITQALIKDPRQRPDASTLLGHAWIRSHLDRSAGFGCAAPVAAAVGRTIASPSAANSETVGHSFSGRAALQQQQHNAAAAAIASANATSNGAGSAAMASDTGSITGSSNARGSISSASASAVTAAGNGAATTIATTIANTTSSGIQRRSSGTPSATAQSFRTAAALLATRSSGPQAGCATPPPAVGAAAASNTPSPVGVSGGMQQHQHQHAYAAPASAPPQQQQRSSAANPPSSFRQSNLTSSTALRSLLDAFKAASVSSSNNGAAAVSGTSNGASNGADRGRTAVLAVRPPSAGSGVANTGNATSNGGNGNSAANLLRNSFQFPLPADRDAAYLAKSHSHSGGNSNGNSSISTAASKVLRTSLQIQLPLEREAQSLGGVSTTAVVGCRASPAGRTELGVEGAVPRCNGGTATALSDILDQMPVTLISRADSPAQLQLQWTAQQAAAAAAAAGGSGGGGGGFSSPPRMARGNAVTTGGLTTGPGSSGSFMSTFLRPVVSLSAAGNCNRTTSPSRQPAEAATQPGASSAVASAATASAAASPGGAHLGKPPRPHSESPGRIFAAAAAAVAAHCSAVTSPLRRALQPSPPRHHLSAGSPRLAPSVSPPRHPPLTSPPWSAPAASPPAPLPQTPPSPARNDWSQCHPVSPSAANLHDLTRSWGAVVSVTVGKHSNSANAGGGGGGGGASTGRGSGTGSAFASPQRVAVLGGSGAGGGKVLDSYGLPAPTPVASGLPPSEYCSPRPAGVLERVKYHLRGGGGGGGGGGSMAPVIGVGAQGVSPAQQPQGFHATGPYGNSGGLGAAPLTAVDVM